MVDWLSPSRDALIGREAGRDDRQWEINNLEADVERLGEEVEEARRKALEEAARVTCFHCGRSRPVIKNMTISSTYQHGCHLRWGHRRETSRGVLIEESCQASNIRDLMEKDNG